MPKEFSRTRRVGEQLRRELAPMVQAVARDKGLGLVSLTEVQVSPDLKHAQIYVTRLGSDHDPQRVTRELDSVAWHQRAR